MIEGAVSKDRFLEIEWKFKTFQDADFAMYFLQFYSRNLLNDIE